MGFGRDTHENRRLHRQLLRAVKADNLADMRTVMYSTYDPFNAPLSRLTSGPSKLGMTPVVDAYILATTLNKSVANELSDNLNSVGATFQLSQSDLSSIHKAARYATQGKFEKMYAQLDHAGYTNMGLCVPDALAQKGGI